MQACNLRTILTSLKGIAQEFSGTSYTDLADKKKLFDELDSNLDGNLGAFLLNVDNAPQNTLGYLVGFGSLYVTTKAEKLYNHQYYYGDVTVLIAHQGMDGAQPGSCAF